MRQICLSGSMSGKWTRSYGQVTRAPPDERGGQQTNQTYGHRATSRLYPQKANMPLWTKIALGLIATVASVLWAARSIQARILAAAVNGLEDRARLEPQLPLAPQSLERLPPPVLRYLNHALPPPLRGLRLARYQQRGTLRTNPRNENWMKFTASQVIGPRTTEFLWTARAEIAPLLHVQVKDSLVGGQGSGQVALLSAVPVASAGGTLEMNSGSLHRFLAEAVWYPSALLPSSQLLWTPVDDFRAVATLTRGPVTVSLEFRFSLDNEVTSIYTPGRWGSFDGAYKQVAWEGKFRNYSRRNGVLVPTDGEVGWYTDGQWQSVWRGTVVSTSMEFQ